MVMLGLRVRVLGTGKSRKRGLKVVNLKVRWSEIRNAISVLEQHPPRLAGAGRSCSIAEAISWEMRECDFMLARSDTGAGQPEALIITRMAAAMAKIRPGF